MLKEFLKNFKAKFLIWTMENFCKRFPHVAEGIFDQVNEQSLNICKEISGDVLEYLDTERFFWIRIIKKYQRRLKDHPYSTDMVGLLYIALQKMATLVFANLSLMAPPIKIQLKSNMMEIHHFIGQLTMDTWKFVNSSWRTSLTRTLPTGTMEKHHFILLLNRVNLPFVNSCLKICQLPKKLVNGTLDQTKILALRLVD